MSWKFIKNVQAMLTPADILCVPGGLAGVLQQCIPLSFLPCLRGSWIPSLGGGVSALPGSLQTLLSLGYALSAGTVLPVREYCKSEYQIEESLCTFVRFN